MNPSAPLEAYPEQGSARPPLPDHTRSTTDPDLLRRMAAGDEAALGVLYDRWSALLHSVIVRIVGDRDDAEEALEETFWQAWRQAGRYEPSRGAASTWLAMIARTRAVDRV
ncbi:MAG TPA: sigma factor, partial [Longimicrobiaceae bacterium]|nr:sigma factor [Longimicrobiaceae bacterium]